MLPNLDSLKKRFEELNEALLNPNIDRLKRQALQKEHSYLSAILSKVAEIEDVNKSIVSANTELSLAQDVDMKSLFEEEISDLQHRLSLLNKELEDTLFPAEF